MISLYIITVILARICLIIYITFVFLHWLSTTIYPKSRRKKTAFIKKKKGKKTNKNQPISFLQSMVEVCA